MKYIITILIFFISFNLFAQIQGSGEVQTRTMYHESIRSIDISLYAEVNVYTDRDSTYIKISAEDNLFEHISYELMDEQLVFTQRNWIQPTQPIQIEVSAPNLESLTQGAHGITTIRGLTREDLDVNADVGEVWLSGKVYSLTAQVNTAQIDATSLDTQIANLTVTSWGEIVLKNPEQINGVVNLGTVIHHGSPAVNLLTTDRGKVVDTTLEKVEKKVDTAKFIQFELKNNSLNRKHFFVEGPKPDGSWFGYGFPMNPLQVRSKNWTVGTKLYQQSKLGLRKLILTIQESDKGETVLIYEKNRN